MGNISEEINRHLDHMTGAVTIGGVTISQCVYVTWGVMLVLVLLSVWFTRHMEVKPTKKRQIIIEMAVGKLYDMFYGLVGEAGKRYIPYLLTVLFYLAFSNLLGLLGIAPPAKDLNVTAGLALMSIVLVEAASIRRKGVGRFLRSFTRPMAIVTPLNMMEIFIKPLSLCMRLFGNVLGTYIIMEMIKAVVPAVVPMIAGLYFDIFDGLLQAYVFVFLTSLYLKEGLAEEE